MDLEKPLVSIIVACFNEENYIGELLDSILRQSYKNVEIICIDDGSTDNTAKIVNEYEARFQNAGMRLVYEYQENRGQAAATNRGLKLVKGKYLSWIDGDDYLYSMAIQKKVEFLEKNPECAIVTSNFHLLYQEENDRKEEKNRLYGNLSFQPNQFFLTITGESIIENLAHLIRMDSLRKANPELEISECREGQNYQLLLPVLFGNKRGYIDEPLACYRIHSDSHCHRKRTWEEQMKRYDNLIKMLEEILTALEFDEERRMRLIRRSTFYLEKARYIDDVRNCEMVRE